MTPTALSKKILITDAGSVFGEQLCSSLLGQGFEVYGSGKVHPAEEILTNSKFTLIDLDLSQPLPAHLPVFDLIIHLSSEKIESTNSLSTVSKNIVSIARDNRDKVFFCMPITNQTDVFDLLIHEDEKKKNLKIILVGDIYSGLTSINKGESYFSKNILTEVINQAAESNKIILENEGLTTVYPLFIKDAVSALNKFIISNDSKQVKFLISQPPLTSLSAAYEIQTVAQVVLKKEIGIFFKGSVDQKIETQPIVRIPDLGFSPKYKLDEGLKEILEPNKSTNTKTEGRSVATASRDNMDLGQILDTRKAEKKKFSFKKPTLFRLNSKVKLILSVISLAIIVFGVKLSIDIYMGISGLKKAEKFLYSGNFSETIKIARSSNSSFTSAGKEAKFITFPLGYLFKEKANSLDSIFKMAQLSASSTENFAQGAQILSKNLNAILSENSGDKLNIEDPVSYFNKAYFDSSYAVALSQNAANTPVVGAKINKITSDIKKLNEISKASSEITSILSNLTGEQGKKTYLVLLLNNTELRPGGGFIGNYGEINFLNGKLESIKIDDIYNIDGQLKEKIQPPTEITQKLGQKQYFLRDSNWSLDFALNAKTARDFYKKETAKTVDGVIAFDLTYIQNLLEKIGPLKLDDYKEEITATNLFEKGEYYAEVGFFPGSTQKKDFFSSLGSVLISKLISTLTSQDKTSSLVLIEETKKALHEKHLQIDIDDQKVASLVKANGWNNPTPPQDFNPDDNNQETRDYLALSEANLGANKSNRYLERRINYEMTIGKEADLVAGLSISYKNNSPSESWPAGTYVNFLRIYTPLGATIEDYSNGDNKDLKSISVSTQGNLTVFSVFVEVPVKSEKTVKIKYRIPKNIKLETAPTYSLLIQKQPGTEKDKLNFKLNLPGYLKTDVVNGQKLQTQNYSNETDFLTDKKFTVSVLKK